MTGAFVQGILAGLAIAVPVGAIGILIIETGLRRGFRLALAAGAGTASADGIYATVAAAVGVALADVIAPWARPLRALAVVVLVGLGLLGLRAARATLRPGPASGAEVAAAPGVEVPGVEVPGAPRARSTVRTYLTFLGLTLLNPMTVIYFASLILGLTNRATTAGEKAAFVVGAFGASLAWQAVLAAAGALLHRRLPPGLRVGASLVGNVIILLFAGAIARDLLA